ncbi:MAG: hypothetical protein Q8P67_15350, partial [archaeon]|nr:hypothetical protein [archaeon]
MNEDENVETEGQGESEGGEIVEADEEAELTEEGLPMEGVTPHRGGGYEVIGGGGGDEVPVIRTKQIIGWKRVPGSAFNLINATIGAGILGLPRMVALCGVVLGPLLIALFGLLTNYSLRILHQVSLASGRPTYEMVAHHMYSKRLGVAVTVAIIVICWGALIAYMIVIADFLVPVMTQWFGSGSFFRNRVFIISWTAALVLLPLSMIRNLKSLEWTSLASILLSFGFVVIVVLRCFVPVFNVETVVYFNFSMQVFQGLGIVIFAFDCSSNLIPIALEMHGANNTRTMTAVVFSATTVSALSYIVCGVFGYLSFYGATDGNILNNYGDDDVLITVMRLVLTVTIMLTFPLVMFPCRLSLDRLLFPSLPPFPAPNPSHKPSVSQRDVESSPLLSSSSSSSTISVSSSSTFETDTSCIPFSDSQNSLSSSLQQSPDHGGDPSPLYLTQVQGAETEPAQSSCDSLLQRYCVGSVMIGYVKVQKSSLRFVGLTLVLLITSYILAVLLPSVDVVFSLVGSSASSCLSYIFPAILWFSNRHQLTNISSGPLVHKINTFFIPVLGVLGVIFGVLGTTMSIID